MEFFTAYGKKQIDLGVDCTQQPSCTKQSFKDECDINTLMAKYEKTGLLEFVNNNEPRYLDASSIDFHEAQNIVANANSMFNEMPGALRQFFDNDPGSFLAFIEDPTNDAQAVEMGLKIAPKPSEGLAPSARASEPPSPVNPLPTDGPSGT